MMNLKLAACVAAALIVLQDPPKNPDLALQLQFEEGKVTDVSGQGNAGKTVGTVAWGEGRKGAALKLDGAGGHVELAGSASLDKVQAENYSLAAWFKPEDVPPGKEAENKARYGILVKEGWHSGLSYNNEKQFVMEHWLAPAAGSEEPVWAGAGTWEDSWDAGKWYHLVGVVDRKAGATKLYLNGELKNSADWEAGKAARDTAKSPWRVGIASPTSDKWAWPAKGSISDIRIYRKALSDAEISAIYKEGNK